MTTNKPNIFNYADYRTFLNDYYHFLKQQDPKFSHRLIAYKIGSSSAGWFSDLVGGRINLNSLKLTKRVQATGSAPDGFVRSVKFYRDSVLLATDTIAPYVWSKVNPATGLCRLHAIATDNSGASTTSSIVTVTIIGTKKP